MMTHEDIAEIWETLPIHLCHKLALLWADGNRGALELWIAKGGIEDV
jgi:hypothetical protein